MRVDRAYVVFDRQTGTWLTKSPELNLRWSNLFTEAYLFKSMTAPKSLLGAYLEQSDRYLLQEVEATWVIKRQSVLTL